MQPSLLQPSLLQPSHLQPSHRGSGRSVPRAASVVRAARAIAIYGAVIALLVLGCAPPGFARIRIGIIGDQTGATDLDKAYQVLQQGVSALSGQRPDVVLHTGDLVESTQAPDDIKARFNQATAILNQLPMTWYMAAGDHDVSPPDFVQNSPDRSREQLFQQLYGGLNPLAQAHLYYSFDLNNYHFVVLYALEALDTDPRWGNVFFSNLSDAQYDWLANDLATHAAASGVIVLLHQPMWYMWSNWSRVHQLLARYPTRAVIAGHFHYNEVDSTVDRIAYRVVGATGADTKHGSSNAGDLQHVTLLTIEDDGSLDFRMIPLAPYVQIAWTSRPVMDRVQAQDVLLGNMYSFPQDSPVYLKNGALVAACDQAAPARLVLSHLGNADAVPVNVQIDVVAPNVKVDGSFGQGMCAQVSTPQSCTLNPSAGVAVSNNSTIEPSQYPPPPPLWTGVVTALGPPPPPQTRINVSVSILFTADNQQFQISHSSATTVQACN